MCGSIETTTRPSSGYLQIHLLLVNLKPVTGPDAVRIEDAVVAVKRWFHGQTERSLVVLDLGVSKLHKLCPAQGKERILRVDVLAMSARKKKGSG
jgi:hypothetical protein